MTTTTNALSDYIRWRNAVNNSNVLRDGRGDLEILLQGISLRDSSFFLSEGYYMFEAE